MSDYRDGWLAAHSLKAKRPAGPPPRLEWSGMSLYVWRGKRRDYVGTIFQNLFSHDWTVQARGRRLEHIPTEDHARRELEILAQQDAAGRVT